MCWRSVVAIALVAALAAEPAWADDVVRDSNAVAGVSEGDSGPVRFRGGVGVTGGILDVPGGDRGVVGVVGPYAHVGAQLDDTVGLFGVYEFDAVFTPKLGGVRVRHAMGIDFTFADRVSIGAGPSLGGLVGVGGTGVEAGARLHVQAYPWMDRSRARGPRKGVALTADVTPAALFSTGGVALNGVFAVHASFGVGYEVF